MLRFSDSLPTRFDRISDEVAFTPEKSPRLHEIDIDGRAKYKQLFEQSNTCVT